MQCVREEESAVGTGWLMWGAAFKGHTQPPPTTLTSVDTLYFSHTLLSEPIYTKTTTFWNVVPCNFVNKYHRFWGICCLCRQSNLKMEEEASSEMLSCIYQSAWPSMPEDANLHRASNLTNCVSPPLSCKDSLDRWNLMQYCVNENRVAIQVLHLTALKNFSLLKDVSNYIHHIL